MFFGQIEKELLCGEIWSVWQTTKLPEHLQLLADQELGKRDIWELQTQKPKKKPNHLNLDDDSNHSTSI
ncbi:MAG: hypothetical protein V7L22_04630 [Nostoc sp.]|uniref:hypothetical protein n=1 Tax=Nostoc sp. TaxID=1180 RepID=UPI002FF8CEE5